MSNLKLIAFCLLGMPLLAHVSEGALNSRLEKLVEFETKANGAVVRYDKMVPMPHLEIPLKYVYIDFAARLDSRIAQALIFSVNGEKMVRWILNPEDTQWGNEIIRFFEVRFRIKLEKKFYFYGYQTASRSYIAEDPISGVHFSVKSSTNVTGGPWKDKLQPMGEATDSRLISDFLQDQNKKRPFKHFVVMDEPAILGLKVLNQAVVIRDLNEIGNSSNKKFYLPGFSALHEEVGAEIAKRNGSYDPYQYWTENYVKAIARAMGELAGRTGLQFDSPHSQNFLVELDENMKPTGRIILRDMADIFIDERFMIAIEGNASKTFAGFTQRDKIKDYISASFGPFYGNILPSWVSPEEQRRWMHVYYDQFEKTFLEITGYNLKILHTVRLNIFGAYFWALYKHKEKAEFDMFFQTLRTKGFAPSPEVSDRVVSNDAGRCKNMFRTR